MANNTATRIPAGEICVGDILINIQGEPTMTITAIHRAQARNYLVFYGTKANGYKDQTGIHRLDTRTVLRKS